MSASGQLTSPPRQTTSTPEKGQTANNEEEQKQRLVLYNSLFGQDRNKLCDKTGLQFTQSLNYSLHTFLHLCDKYWILSIIDVDEYDSFKDKYGESRVKNKLNQIGTVIKNFCINSPNKLKGFKCQRNDLIIDDGDDELERDHDLYALLLYCHPQLNVSQKYIIKLQKKIKQQTNETVSVGIAKMNAWETFDEWKKRAFKNLKHGKEMEILTDTIANQTVFSDVNVKYVNPNQSDEKDEKQQERGTGVVNKLGNKEEFESKMKEIANNEDYEWIMGIMEIDNFDSFVFNNNDNNKEIISKETKKIEKEMFHLFDIFGNGTIANKNEIKYFGYILNLNGSKYGLILYDSKDRNKCFIAAHSLIETLSSEIKMKCSFSVSIGSSRLIEDDLGMTDELIERINNNLKHAQKNGGNQVCFVIGINNINADNDNDNMDIKSDQENMFNDTRDDDIIQENTLGVIEKYGVSAYVDFKSVSLIVNNGDLINENDLNLKCDFDPTQTSKFQSITNIKYKDIFFEVAAFIDKNNGKYSADKDNNSNSNKRRYLEYPRLCLNGNKPKCSDKEHCKQCHGSTNHSNSSGIFSLCSTIRRQIADELFDRGQLEKCTSDSLYKTASKLCMNDRLLIEESKENKLNKNWFVKVYSFLMWQQEVVHILLHNLVYLNKTSQSQQMKIGTADADEVKENDFSLKFDALTILNSYLDELIEYFVLYYCCFDSQLWIGIFYPCIECGIGTKQCKVLFAQPSKENKNSVKTSHFSHIVAADANIEMKRACVQETKTICILKRLLYDVYQRDNDEDSMDIATTTAMKNVQNAFNLANQVCTKLQETINNIKTQLLLREMTMIDNQNDLKKEDCSNQERKDDWDVDDNNSMNKNSVGIETPSFIRLFVIRRIIDKHIQNNKDKKNEKKEILKELANVFKDDKETESLVINILTTLINEGIKRYMDKYYNEKEQENIIEDIFDKIVLEKFKQDYNEMTKYDKTNNNNYQNLLFNSSDLMNQIFQYLEWGFKFDEDLYACSLVNSHWLYHVWNPNSVYHVDFDNLLEYYDNDKHRTWMRIWQRLCNAKSIYLQLVLGAYSETALRMVNKLSMLRKVEKVDVSVFVDLRMKISVDKCISVVKPIMSKCKDRVKYCRIEIGTHRVDSSDFEAPSPLMLPKARYVEIGDLWFYRHWTDECIRLKLWRIKKIKKDWCQFVIANCDCSSITTLTLGEVAFDKKSINEGILKQFALKFYNLKTLEIEFNGKVDDNVLLFWQLLKPIISKNKSKVKLKIDYLKDGQEILLRKGMDEKYLNIDKLMIRYRDDDNAIKLIQERDGRGLNHLAFEHLGIEPEKNLLHKFKCKSITTFELKGGNMTCVRVNALLEWKMISEKQIFVIIDTHGSHRNIKDREKALSAFKQLCQNVYQLFVQQIAFDIKIKFRVRDSRILSSYLSIYSSYFQNGQDLSKYNKVKCKSNLCLPRSKPYTYFYMHDSKKSEDDRYLVFGASNVEMK